MAGIGIRQPDPALETVLATQALTITEALAQTTMLDKLNQLSLQSKRLRIRSARESDLAALYEVHSVDEVNQYLPYETWRDIDDARAWYAKVIERRRDQIAEQFVIVERSGSARETLVGTIIVFSHDVEKHSMEFGYVLAKAAWRRGIMTEALNTFIPALVATLSLAELNASVEAQNTRSLKLLDRLEFTEYQRTVDDGIELILLTKTFA